LAIAHHDQQDSFFQAADGDGVFLFVQENTIEELANEACSFLSATG